MIEKNRKILAIIPARSGSKGLPNKNLAKIIDEPLISFTIKAAKNSKLVDTIVVSSDSESILDVANHIMLKR